jgi:hypothetical protein
LSRTVRIPDAVSRAVARLNATVAKRIKICITNPGSPWKPRPVRPPWASPKHTSKSTSQQEPYEKKHSQP